jgi:hypothetical protein
MLQEGYIADFCVVADGFLTTAVSGYLLCQHVVLWKTLGFKVMLVLWEEGFVHRLL